MHGYLLLLLFIYSMEDYGRFILNILDSRHFSVHERTNINFPSIDIFICINISLYVHITIGYICWYNLHVYIICIYIHSMYIYNVCECEFPLAVIRF